MTFKNFSSRPPVANSEIADTPLSGGEVARQRGEKVARILCGMNGLLIFVALCFVGHAVYCAVLESKLKAIVAPEFRLESATISLHEVNSKYTAVDWEVKLVAINPNTDIGLHCHDSSLATVNFYGYENFRATVARGLLPDFFINNGTQNVISFKLGMVTRSNDRMVSKTVEQLRRAPRSVTTLFGFEINILYSFDNKKMCSVNCRRTKEYFWEPPAASPSAPPAASPSAPPAPSPSAPPAPSPSAPPAPAPISHHLHPVSDPTVPPRIQPPPRCRSRYPPRRRSRSPPRRRSRSPPRRRSRSPPRRRSRSPPHRRSRRGRSRPQLRHWSPPANPVHGPEEEKRPPFFLRALFFYVLYVFISSAVFFFFSSSFQLYAAPSPQPPPLLDRIVAAFYFVEVSTFTIGYGDVAPLTTTGQLIAIAIDLFSYLFISRLISEGIDDMILRSEVSCGFETMEERRRTYIRGSVAMFTIFVGLASGYLGAAYLQYMSQRLDSIYLVLLTLTTIGYGDTSFTTLHSRFFAICWIALFLPVFERACRFLVSLLLPCRCVVACEMFFCSPVGVCLMFCCSSIGTCFSSIWLAIRDCIRGHPDPADASSLVSLV